MVDWAIYKSVWANFLYIVGMWMGMPQNFFINSKYIELQGVILRY